jgi:hypothetical protein
MASVHEFFTKQHEHLNRVETSIVKMRADLEASRNEAMASLKAKREKAAASRQAFQLKIADSVNKMKANAEERKAQTDATVEEWKRKREVNKLENRARDLEDYADAALTVVDLAQEEAGVALLEAIEARRQAEEAKLVGATA